MSNLSKTVNTTRKIIIGFIIFVIIVLGIQFASQEIEKNKTTISSVIKNSPYLFPNKDSSAYSRFNLISKTLKENVVPEFSKVGFWPKTFDSVNVYKIKEKKVTLSSIEQAQKISEKFNLKQNYEKLDTNTYRWTNIPNTRILEFNRLNHEIKFRRDLIIAAKTPISIELSREELIQSTISLVEGLGLGNEDVKFETGRVDYVALNSDRSFRSIPTTEGAQFARVTLFKKIEGVSLAGNDRVITSSGTNTYISTSIQPQDGQTSEVASTVLAEIRRPDVFEGGITLFLNGNASKIGHIVQIDYIPFEYKNNFDTYAVMEFEQAFEKIKSGDIASNLMYIAKTDSDIFEPYSEQGVLSFSIDASKARLIYIETDDYSFLDPSQKWNAQIYPYYWFEGLAALENGDEATFIFLVDPIPR